MTDSRIPPSWAAAYAAGDYPPWALTADVIPIRPDVASDDLQGW